MTCRELVEFLNAYIDNELPTLVRARFLLHLATCPSCRAYLDTYRRTLALEKTAFQEPTETALPTGMPEELVRAMLEARK